MQQIRLWDFFFSYCLHLSHYFIPCPACPSHSFSLSPVWTSQQHAVSLRRQPCQGSPCQNNIGLFGWLLAFHQFTCVVQRWTSSHRQQQHYSQSKFTLISTIIQEPCFGLIDQGCVMRNTAEITGLVIFSGHDTKLMQNACDPPRWGGLGDSFVFLRKLWSYSNLISYAWQI